jgi:uncharacterized delta-60 repeat protein
MVRRILLLLSIFILTNGIAFSAPGDLDATFGSNGVAMFSGPMDSGQDFVRAVVQQSDGKIVASIGGTTNVLVRYHPDGTLDDSFGHGGILVAPGLIAGPVALQQDGKMLTFGSLNGSLAVVRLNDDGASDGMFGIEGGTAITQFDSPIGIGVQRDGKIVVMGRTGTVLVLLRYSSDGTLDGAFGEEGIVTHAASGPWDAMAIQPDGRIVVATSIERSTYGEVLILRYNEDGAPDLSFGAAGAITQKIGRAYDRARDLAIQGDGKIVVSGGCARYGSDDSDAFVTRINADGTVDDSFGSNGVVFFNTMDHWPSDWSSDAGTNIAIQGDGKIILAGYSIGAPGGYLTFLVRYGANGTLDESFGLGGVIVRHKCSSFYPTGDPRVERWAVTIQPDGKILFGNSHSDGRNEDFLLERYTSDGTLDSTFGEGGAVIYDSKIRPAFPIGEVLAVQPDGKIVIAGSTTNGTNLDALVIRYNVDGTLDSAFGEGGFVRYNGPHNLDDVGLGLALQPDGKILVSGYTNAVFTSGNFMLLRYNADGILDDTFGVGGVVSFFGAYLGMSVLIQPGGKIVVGGAHHRGSWEGVAYRFNTDGSADLGFGNEGVYRDGSVYVTLFEQAALQADGKIVLAGRSQGDWDLLVTRVNADGTSDNTFGTDGSFRFRRDYYHSAAGTCLVVQEDGRIVVGGNTWGTSSSAAVLLRLQPDGTMDNTFGEAGVSIFDTTQTDYRLYWYSIALQPDGKIVSAGKSKDNGAIIARYNPDGTLDQTFGTAGVVRFWSEAAAYGVVMQGDGRIVVTGYARAPEDYGEYSVYQSFTARLIGGAADPPPPPPPPPPPNPDLKGKWSSLTQTCRETAKGVKCKVKGIINVQNAGTLDAASSLVRFYLSDDEKYDEGVDTFLKQVATGKLKAGTSKLKKLNYSLRTGKSASGKYIIAAIDTDNTVVETDETNNTAPYGPIL